MVVTLIKKEKQLQPNSAIVKLIYQQSTLVIYIHLFISFFQMLEFFIDLVSGSTYVAK